MVPVNLQAPIRTRKGPSGRKFSDEGRNQQMIAMFRSGMLTPEIGALFGIHQRSVSRILRAYGIDRSEGGKEVKARLRREERASVEWAERLSALDCAPDELTPEQLKVAIRKFHQQKHRAKERGIGWELTFGQWWRIWVASGKWDVRGRAHAESAVMSRRGDVGPYSVGNVHITTLADNFRESHQVRGHNVKGSVVHVPSVFSYASR